MASLARFYRQLRVAGSGPVLLHRLKKTMRAIIVGSAGKHWALEKLFFILPFLFDA
jgi:hypothetical protein